MMLLPTDPRGPPGAPKNQSPGTSRTNCVPPKTAPTTTEVEAIRPRTIGPRKTCDHRAGGAETVSGRAD